MASNKALHIVKRSSHISFGLEPLKLWMRVIALIPPPSRASCRSPCLLFVFGTWLFITVVHCMMLFVFFQWDNNTFFATTGETNFEKATFSWIHMINYATNAIHSFGVHSSVLVLVVHNSWEELEETLKQSDIRFRLPLISKIKYRRYCVTGIIYTIFSVIKFLILKFC